MGQTRAYGLLHCRARAAAWQFVRVVGPSMVPALHDGDVVIVRHSARVRPGAVVLARYRSMPERPVLKRAVRPVEGGWWLASDNPFAGGGSDVHGVADVVACVMAVRRGGRGRPRRLADSPADG